MDGGGLMETVGVQGKGGGLRVGFGGGYRGASWVYSRILILGAQILYCRIVIAILNITSQILN